jgi:hypothetical protein
MSQRSPIERQAIVDQVRHHIAVLDLEDILEIRKLQIMLDLYEKYAYEFDRYLPNIEELDKRGLEVKLYNNPDRVCSIMLKKCKT